MEGLSKMFVSSTLIFYLFENTYGHIFNKEFFSTNVFFFFVWTNISKVVKMSYFEICWFENE